MCEGMSPNVCSVKPCGAKGRDYAIEKTPPGKGRGKFQNMMIALHGNKLNGLSV